VVPAALVVFVIYLFMGSGMHSPQHVPDVSFVKVIPYLIVLLTAIFGMNVMAVLALGILSSGLIGLLTSSFDFYGWMGAMGEGVVGMGELIIITMMAGGLLEIIKHNGGIDFLIRLLTSHVSNKRGAELSIAALVSMVNLCTANNTVAILTVGGIAKQIGDRYGVDNRKCASILDTFSCTMQGFLPYGAQLLMAAGLASISPTAIIPHLYYPMAIGLCALAAILFRYPRRYS
jgi:Na+/H+ antiporter NhaC